MCYHHSDIPDKALALEIMAQTLDKDVCTACAALVDISDVTDERRLAILALCGPESVGRRPEAAWSAKRPMWASLSTRA
jgi:hypothetical protein